MRVEQKAPFYLQLTFDKYTGNFEREFVSYVLGVLDEVQLSIDYDDRNQFMKLCQTEEGMSEDECFAYIEDHFFETYQEVDDWEQVTFYNIAWGVDGTKIKKETNCNSILLQLAHKPTEEFMERLIRRGVKFCFTEELKTWGTATEYGHDASSQPSEFSIALLDEDKTILEQLFYACDEDFKPEELSRNKPRMTYAEKRAIETKAAEIYRQQRIADQEECKLNDPVRYAALVHCGLLVK